MKKIVLLILLIFVFLLSWFNFKENSFIIKLKDQIKSQKTIIELQDIVAENTLYLCAFGEYESKENLKWKIGELRNKKLDFWNKLLMKYHLFFMEDRYLIFLIDKNNTFKQFKVPDFFILDEKQYNFVLLKSEDSFCFNPANRKFISKENKFTTTLELR